MVGHSAISRCGPPDSGRATPAGIPASSDAAQRYRSLCRPRMTDIIPEPPLSILMSLLLAQMPNLPLPEKRLGTMAAHQRCMQSPASPPRRVRVGSSGAGVDIEPFPGSLGRIQVRDMAREGLWTLGIPDGGGGLDWNGELGIVLRPGICTMLAGRAQSSLASRFAGFVRVGRAANASDMGSRVRSFGAHAAPRERNSRSPCAICGRRMHSAHCLGFSSLKCLVLGLHLRLRIGTLVSLPTPTRRAPCCADTTPRDCLEVVGPIYGRATPSSYRGARAKPRLCVPDWPQ